MSIESVMLFNHLILCCPLLLLPSISPTIRVFSNESPLPIRWPEFWNFSFSISSFYEQLGLISFTGLSSLQCNRLSGVFSSTTVENHQNFSPLFMVQLSHPYMTTRKTIALTKWTFVGTVMSLLFYRLYRLVIAFWSWLSWSQLGW